MASGTPSPSEYVKHHITNLSYGEGLWTIHADTLVVSIELYDDDMTPVWSTSEPDELTFGPRETLMRVEARVEMPTVMFTDLMFGDAAAQLGTGITFMTEP